MGEQTRDERLEELWADLRKAAEDWNFGWAEQLLEEIRDLEDED